MEKFNITENFAGMDDWKETDECKLKT